LHIVQYYIIISRGADAKYVNLERAFLMHFILIAAVVVLAVVIYKLKSDKDNHM